MIEVLKNLTLKNSDGSKISSEKSAQIIDLLDNCIGKSQYASLNLIALSEKRFTAFLDECGNSPFVKVLETDDSNAVNMIFGEDKVASAMLIIETTKDCKFEDIKPKFTNVKKCDIAIRFNDDLKTKFRLTALYY